MRYMTVTYIRKPDGRWDESVTVAKNLKTRDYTMANVILDFKDCAVIKCSMNSQTVPKDWQKIRDFYHNVYPQYINQLESANANLY